MEKFSIVSGGVHHQYHYCLGGYLAGNDVQGVKTTQLLIHRGCILIKWNSPFWYVCALLVVGVASEGQPLAVCCVWLVLCVMSSVVEASV